MSFLHAQPAIDTTAKQYFLFSYFLKQDAGVNLAVSTNGINWVPVNKGNVVATARVGEKLVRDPSINLGPDGVYRMVWTTGWKSKTIGYAASKDPVHWGEEQAIPVGAAIDSTTNCWAPEIYYDTERRRYMIYWSSNVGPWKKGGEGRIYYVTTPDFKTFSKPEVLFRNGFPAGGAPGNKGPIDAFIYKDTEHRFLLFYKKDDNSKVPTIYFRAGETPEGPWGNEHGPVTPSTGDEGPSVVRIGDRYCLFTDPFESDFAYMFVSADLKTWQREVTDLKMAHGTVIEIPKNVALRLIGR
ncbi:glycoside hydrolase family 43 protein [Mucilaginibacter sp. OK268]|uniref:glycoside hydrolase family 43 protein n=1 Tax=Mucilaginibacter sp. OK268 TaxID=1881048 RepID=UPI0015A0A097|nr:glycoside hydrolase family 43 protein [Mucilaginibacter sp. OK268]